MFRLEKADAHQAVDEFLRIPHDLMHWAKPAVPLLMRHDSGHALSAACRIGPERDEDFVRLLRAMEGAQGSMISDLVTLLEQSGPGFDNRIETIAEFLQHSHYRVRIAAARALKGMDTLLELIEQPLLKAMEDPSPSVVEAVVETLAGNVTYLTPNLLAALHSSPITPLPAEKRESFDQLERYMWWPRTDQLNAADADEDVIFIYRHKSLAERSEQQAELVEQLMVAHGLPPRPGAFHEVDFGQFHLNLREALKPVYYSEPCVEQSTEELAVRLRSLFHEDAVLLGNHRYDRYDKEGHVGFGGGVTYNIVDHGVICLDDDHVGFFFVTDED